MQMSINMDAIKAFEDYLTDSEKARATIKKYVYATEQLSWFLGDQELCKARILEYREQLLKSRKAQTVNTALSAINAFLEFYGRTECKVKLLRIQRQAFLDERRELSHEEYSRLLAAAKGRRNERLYLTILTLCGTGIRIGELQFITVESARTGRAEKAELLSCKKNCADGCSNTQRPTELSTATSSAPGAVGLWTVPMSATI